MSHEELCMSLKKTDLMERRAVNPRNTPTASQVNNQNYCKTMVEFAMVELAMVG